LRKIRCAETVLSVASLDDGGVVVGEDVLG
jgi:hypothetical protein